MQLPGKLLREGCDVLSEARRLSSFRRRSEGLLSARLLQQAALEGMESWVIPPWLYAARNARLG